MIRPTEHWVVSSDDDAWALLNRWLEGGDLPDVEFVGWPTLRVRLSGGDYSASLNFGQMAALINLRMTAGRAYSSVAHGAYDMRHLKEEEEDQLEFRTEVRPGSSITDTDLSPVIQAVASVITTHPSTSLVAALLIGLAFVSRPVILKYFENRAKEMEISERRRLLDLSLSGRERDEYRLFEQATKKLEKSHPKFGRTLPDVRSAFLRLASSAVDADEMSVSSITFSQEDLQVLSERRKRRPADVSEFSNTFQVTAVKKVKGVYRIKLESKALVLTAIYRRPHLTDAGIRSLIACMTNEIEVQATLELRTVEGQVSGQLLRFATLPTK